MKSVLLTRELPSEFDKIWNEFEGAARNALGSPAQQGRAVKKSGQQEEQEYSLAYQKLVQEGLVMQIKEKYR
jgi:hypothetical protein